MKYRFVSVFRRRRERKEENDVSVLSASSISSLAGIDNPRTPLDFAKPYFDVACAPPYSPLSLSSSRALLVLPLLLQNPFQPPPNPLIAPLSTSPLPLIRHGSRILRRLSPRPGRRRTRERRPENVPGYLFALPEKCKRVLMRRTEQDTDETAGSKTTLTR
jgi:hypothetical protein